MARKPARLERAGALTPRDRMWAAIRQLAHWEGLQTGARFSAVEVAFIAGQGVDATLSYMQCLVAGEFIFCTDANRPLGRKRRELALYYLVKDCGVEAPRLTAEGKPVTAGIGREQMWKAMKALQIFDFRELQLAATTIDHKIAEEEAKTYIAFLWRAGYLALRNPAKPGGRNRVGVPARYSFVKSRNTGPRAPLVARDKSVMDQNTGEVVWQPTQS